MSNMIRINNNAVPFALINFLKEKLNFPNSAFLIKKNSSIYTFKKRRLLNLIEESENEILLPRGFFG